MVGAAEGRGGSANRNTNGDGRTGGGGGGWYRWIREDRVQGGPCLHGGASWLRRWGFCTCLASTVVNGVHVMSPQ
eukprot:2269974-Prorocentrum_lima.AAC.1